MAEVNGKDVPGKIILAFEVSIQSSFGDSGPAGNLLNRSAINSIFYKQVNSRSHNIRKLGVFLVFINNYIHIDYIYVSEYSHTIIRTSLCQEKSGENSGTSGAHENILDRDRSRNRWRNRAAGFDPDPDPEGLWMQALLSKHEAVHSGARWRTR